MLAYERIGSELVLTEEKVITSGLFLFARMPCSTPEGTEDPVLRACGGFHLTCSSRSPDYLALFSIAGAINQPETINPNLLVALGFRRPNAG